MYILGLHGICPKSSLQLRQAARAERDDSCTLLRPSSHVCDQVEYLLDHCLASCLLLAQLNVGSANFTMACSYPWERKCTYFYSSRILLNGFLLPDYNDWPYNIVCAILYLQSSQSLLYRI